MGTTVRLWDLADRNPAPVPQIVPTQARFATFSADGRRFVTAGENPSGTGEAQVWATSPLQKIGEALPHVGEVIRAVFDPAGQLVLTISFGGRLDPDKSCVARLWNASSGEEHPDKLPHPRIVSWAEFDRSGERFLTAGLNGEVRIWARTGVNTELIAILKHDSEVYRACFDESGRVATACQDGTAQVWSANTFVKEFSFLHPGPVWLAAFRPDKPQLVTVSRAAIGDAELRARVWDVAPRSTTSSAGTMVVATNLEAHGIVGGGLPNLLCAAASLDGHRLLTVTYRDCVGDARPTLAVRTWDITSGNPISVRTSLHVPELGLTVLQPGQVVHQVLRVSAAAPAAGADRVLVFTTDIAHRQNALSMRDPATGEPIPVESAGDGPGSLAEFSRDGRFLVCIDGISPMPYPFLPPSPALTITAPPPPPTNHVPAYPPRQPNPLLAPSVPSARPPTHHRYPAAEVTHAAASGGHSLLGRTWASQLSRNRLRRRATCPLA